VKTLRKAPIAVIALALALTVIGSSCSAVNPVAMSVNNWNLSDKDFSSQLSSFATVYEKANGSASDLRSPDGNSWATSYTAAFLNDQLNLQLARLAVEQRGLTVTQADLDDARALLEENFVSSSGQTFFASLPADYQNSLVAGVAAQNLLLTKLVSDAQSDAGLRRLFESTKNEYSGELVCARHILIVAGNGSGTATPTEAQYATALAQMEKIQGQLVGVSNFADLARTNSQDTGSGPDGGALGCSPRGAFVTEFDNAAWSQPIGVVGQPVKTKFGYHIILVSARGSNLGFDDLKEQLRSSIAQSASELLGAELARVAADARIGVDGRYGQYDSSTLQIVAPAGAVPPSTTLSPLENMVNSEMR
jgi:parvulin-like peptidyl-prolyl isomerase